MHVPGLILGRQGFLWGWFVLDLKAGLYLFERDLVIVKEMSMEKTCIVVESRKAGKEMQTHLSAAHERARVAFGQQACCVLAEAFGEDANGGLIATRGEGAGRALSLAKSVKNMWRVTVEEAYLIWLTPSAVTDDCCNKF